MIGIAGGMGPMAGVKLSEKIIAQTIATNDQEHLPQILYSAPNRIGDRTEYLLGIIADNPAIEISKIIITLSEMGASVVGLPCNSAHAPEIFDKIKALLAEKKCRIKLLNMIEEVGKFVKSHFPHSKNIGILGTSGTYKTQLYKQLEGLGFSVINVTEAEVEKVHQAIYHPEYGIKSSVDKVSPASMNILQSAARSLIAKGADIIVLGCTEIPFAFSESQFEGVPLIDSTMVLARSLIAEIDAGKLKKW